MNIGGCGLIINKSFGVSFDLLAFIDKIIAVPDDYLIHFRFDGSKNFLSFAYHLMN